MTDNEQIERKEEPRERRRQTNNAPVIGLILMGVGGVLLARQVGADLPRWLFTWPMIVIVFGLFVGARHNFRDFGWLIFVAVGFFFLADDIFPGFEFGNFIVPAVIILVGLILLLRPKRHHIYRGDWDQFGKFEYNKNRKEDYEKLEESIPGSTEDVVDVVTIFGGVKKNVLSKNFKGGDIVSIFGGSEINLMQADFDRKIVIDTVQIFGGTTLIIPSNWQVRSEAVAIFGGIDDKRKQLTHSEPEKVLVLKGFTMFGGLEIKSF
jgi:predicted membrane protein